MFSLTCVLILPTVKNKNFRINPVFYILPIIEQVFLD